MKKLLAFLLVLVMVLSVALVACSKKDSNNNDDDDDDGWGNGNKETSDKNNEDENNEDENNEDGNTDEENNEDENNDDENNDDNDDYSGSLSFTELAESEQFTAYVTYPVYLRYTADDYDKTSTKLALGDSVRVIATSNGEWYRVKYNEQTYYIYSYLTTKNASAIRFVDLEEPIYSSVINTKTEADSESTHNLRTTPCYDETETYNSEINKLNLYGAVTKSQTSDNKLQVVALSENGSWAKVIYRPDDETQKTLYIKKSQLQAYQSEDLDNELDAA